MDATCPPCLQGSPENPSSPSPGFTYFILHPFIHDSAPIAVKGPHGHSISHIIAILCVPTGLRALLGLNSGPGTHQV